MTYKGHFWFLHVFVKLHVAPEPKKINCFAKEKEKQAKKLSQKKKIRLKKTYVFHRTNFLRYDRTLGLRLQSGINCRRYISDF